MCNFKIRQMKFLFFSIFLFSVCLIIPAQENYIVFGNGGGFSGLATVYKVYQDGKVLKGTGRVDIQYADMGKIKKSAAKKLFRRMNAIKSTSFNCPGNMYYYISLYKNGNEIKYLWGATDFKVPEEIRTFYRETVLILLELEYNPVKNN
jgi:hypothetical protein